MWIGVDPALSSMGLAAIDGNCVLLHKTVHTKAKDDMPTRLAKIAAECVLFCCNFSKVEGIIVERVHAHPQRREVKSMTMYYMALGAILAGLTTEFGGGLVHVLAPTSKGKIDRRNLVLSKYTGLTKRYSEHVIDAIAIVDRYRSLEEKLEKKKGKKK